jgi:hypothetical protein
MSPEVTCMKMPLLRSLLPLLMLALASTPAAAQKLYKWVDKNGQVHYGDRIPPEYAEQDREVLNKQGLSVGREEGAETPEEAKAREEREKAERIAEEQAQRDRMLISTYQNVEEIEQLRARRLDQIDAQILIQEQSLTNLKARHAEQVKRASRFAPRNTDPKAAPMPEGMAEDLERAESDIRTQQLNLEKRRQERAALNRQFDADVARYKELRGMR